MRVVFESNLALKTLICLVLAIILLNISIGLANAGDSTPPSTPTNVSATAGSSPNVYITWSHSSDPESGIRSYIIYRHPYPITDTNKHEARRIAEVSGSTNSYTDTTGITGETYYYAVVAVNGAGLASNVSNNAMATVAGSTDPHYFYSTSTNLCRACHRVHNASASAKLYRKATQKEVCYTCHDGTGSNFNIRAAFGEQTLGSSTKVSYHPIPNAVSTRGTILCTDCHSPHLLDGPSHTAPTNQASNSLRGTWGVEPNPWPVLSGQPKNIPAHPGLTSSPIGGGVCIVKAGNYFYAISGGSSRFWRYDPRTNNWRLCANAPNTFGDGAALAYTGGDYIYALRGGVQPNLYRYQISTNTWTTLANAPGNIGAGGALVWTGGDYLFALAGNNSANFYRYQISNNTWVTRAALPINAGAGASLVWTGGDYIYALAGNATNSFYRYSIAGNSWTQMANVPANVGAGGSLVYTGTNLIYALIGNNTASFVVYNINNNSWSSLANAPGAIGANSGNRLVYDGNGYIYCLRGSTNGEFWRYSIANNAWNVGQDAPTSYLVVKPIQKEYQLCLKCHSNYTTQPNGQLNLAIAINPMSASRHPIVMPASNRYCDIDTMEAPWNQQDWDTGNLLTDDGKHAVMYCSDCHGSSNNNLPQHTNNPVDPRGPHGSNVSKMLRATIVSDSTNGTPLCFICHKRTIYWSGPIVSGINGTRYSDHPSNRGAHKTAAGCLTCHIGGAGVQNGKATTYRKYIHGANILNVVDATNRGPAHAFLFGDGIMYIRQADMNCWTTGFCGTQHQGRTPNYYDP